MDPILSVGVHAWRCWAIRRGTLRCPASRKAKTKIGVLKSMGDACASFAAYGVEGLALDRERVERHVRDSLMLGTALVPFIGYDRAAAVARVTAERGVSLREAAATADITPEQFDAWVDVTRMARPHRA